MAEFKREERYIVAKLTDINACLSEIEKTQLAHLMSKVYGYRVSVGKAPLICAVVESDWPEYEPVWKMVENRVSGICASALVPFLPTEKMIVAAAGVDYSCEDQHLVTQEWQAMIRAAK